VTFADRATRVPITLTATIQNSGTGSATGVNGALQLPPNLVTAPGVPNRQSVGSLGVGATATITWTLNAIPPQYLTKATVTVVVTSQNAPDAIQAVDISLAGMAPILFVHGINANAADIRAGHGWNPLLDPTRARYGARNVFIFDYYQDMGFQQFLTGQPPCAPGPSPDTKVGTLYLDPNFTANASPCDSKSNLAINAALLDDQLQTMPAHTTLIANSLGGAVTRGWLTLAQQRNAQAPDAALAAVDTLIFLQGAAQGSYIAAAGELVNSLGSSRIETWAVTQLAAFVAAKMNFDPNRPGIIDVAGDSLYFRSAVPTPVPSGIHYFAFYTDIHVTNVKINDIFGSVSVPLAKPLTVGDTVMLPGTPTTTDHNWYGGARFLPPPAAGFQRHEFRVDVPVTLNFSSVPGTQGLDLTLFVQSLIAQPASHFHFGDNMNSPNLFTVDSCTGAAPLAPAQKVLQILDTPANACS
jgi:hypothetical protein